MLHMKSLQLTNFGAFKGEQKINFQDGPGVSVFYGENMRGKTTLLNAIRFALFGKVLGRGRRAVSLYDLVNLEARLDGERNFEVRLEMTYAGAEYRLTRTGRPRSSSEAMVENEEYIAEYYLERGGHILPPEQAAQELERILPEQIARFFLFDGELLQEYEDLLHSDTDMGPKISQAIERILGLPTLIGARDGAKAALDRAENAVALAAQGDQKTREYGNQLQSLAAERDVVTNDVFRQEKELENLRGQKAAIEDDMRRRERMASLLDKRDRIIEEIDEAERRQATASDQLGQAMVPAWSAIIRTRMEEAISGLRASETELQSKITRSQVLHELAQGHDPSCPTCLQTVGKDAQEEIRKIVGTDEEPISDTQRVLGDVRRRIDALDRQLSRSNPEALRLLWSNLETLGNEIYSKKAEMNEINRQLTGDEEDELRGLRRDYDSVHGQIIALDGGLRASNEKLIENSAFRDKIQRKLDSLAGGQMEAERQRRELAQRLHELFKSSVDVYREDLRRRIEDDASAFFRSMTTEPDYAGLRINEHYGLTIVHRDGSPIPIRSAGAEHVVALSLVAALQNNAPLRGPIFIDSPFGRLDGGHRERIVATLPDMADQVMLLVYEEEMPPTRARAALKEKLRAEWVLERESARHTRIKKR